MSTTPNQYPRSEADEQAERASQELALTTDRWENFAQPNYGHTPVRILEREDVERQDHENARRSVLINPLMQGEASQNQRVETVRKLRMEADKDSNQPLEQALYYLPKLEFRESHPSPYAPTLGIEIEIYGPTLGLRPEKSTLSDRNDLNDAEWDEEKRMKHKLKENFAITKELGVPQGKDGFWEFANAPVNHPNTLSREVQALIDMNLINREFTRHPLHLTIGGITSVGETGDEAFTLARALEATGWSTSGGRLLKPYHTGKLNWAHKGYAGVNERYLREIEGDNDVAIEIRTMQFQSLTGLHRLLTHSYYLGAALKAYQEKEEDLLLPEDQTLEGRDALAAVWGETSRSINDIFLKYSIASPVDRDRWDQPLRHLESDFFKLADLVDEAADDRESRGGHFVSEIRSSLVSGRIRAAKIMKAEVSKVPEALTH